MNQPVRSDFAMQSEPDIDVVIRQMARSEVRIAADWAADEGWNPGVNDAEVFCEADPQGFFVALENGQPVGCCSAVVYEREFAFSAYSSSAPNGRSGASGCN